MKKTILIAFVLSIAIGLVAQDTPIKTYKNRLSFEPLPLDNNSLAINYERDLSATYSLKFLTQIVYGVEGRSYTKGIVEDVALKIYGVKEKEILNIGFSAYFMPYLHFSSFDILSVRRYYREYDQDHYDRDFHREFSGYGGGILVGFGSTLFKKLCFDVYLGGGIQANNGPDNPFFIEAGEYYDNYGYDRYGNSSTKWEKKGIVPRGGIEVSFKF